MQGGNRVLLDDDGGEAQGLDFFQNLLDLADDYRGQAFVGLVKQQQLHIPRQCTGYGQHLLLAAGHGHRLLLAALGQAGEVVVNPLDGPADGLFNLGQLQVFFHRQARDDAPVFGHQAHAQPGGLVGAHGMQGLAV